MTFLVQLDINLSIDVGFVAMLSPFCNNRSIEHEVAIYKLDLSEQRIACPIRW